MNSLNNSVIMTSPIHSRNPNLNEEMMLIPLNSNTGMLEGRRVKICHPSCKKTVFLITGLGILALSAVGYYFFLNSNDESSSSMGLTLLFSMGGAVLGGGLSLVGAGLFCVKEDLT